MCQAFGGSTASVFLKIQGGVESRKAIHPHLAIGSMRWLHATLGIACLLYKLGTAEHEHRHLRRRPLAKAGSPTMIMSKSLAVIVVKGEQIEE